jgi:hypothetical protein
MQILRKLNLSLPFSLPHLKPQQLAQHTVIQHPLFLPIQQLFLFLDIAFNILGFIQRQYLLEGFLNVVVAVLV